MNFRKKRKKCLRTNILNLELTRVVFMKIIKERVDQNLYKKKRRFVGNFFLPGRYQKFNEAHYSKAG